MSSMVKHPIRSEKLKDHLFYVMFFCKTLSLVLAAFEHLLHVFFLLVQRHFSKNKRFQKFKKKIIPKLFGMTKTVLQ